MTGFEILNRPEFLRFYATLSDAQKGVLKRGAKVPATDFSPDQQVVLGDMIFGPSANFTTEFPAPTAQAGDTTSLDPYNSSANEPTDVLPNGLTPAVTVSAMVEDRETWFSFSKNARFGQAPRPTDANGIAYDDVMRERADLFPQAAQMPVYDLFRQGRQAFWEFEIHISKMLSLNAQLSDNRVLPGEPMTRKQLPAEFLKEIAARAAEIRESFKNMTPEQFGNGKRIKPPL